MTGFARTQGEAGAVSWTWELRSVNGRGLDIKFRLPNGMDALDLPLRDLTAKPLKRGNVSGTLNVKREFVAGITTDLAALERVKALAIELAASIPGALPPRAELLLALPGVMRGVQRKRKLKRNASGPASMSCARPLSRRSKALPPRALRKARKLASIAASQYPGDFAAARRRRIGSRQAAGAAPRPPRRPAGRVDRRYAEPAGRAHRPGDRAAHHQIRRA